MAKTKIQEDKKEPTFEQTEALNTPPEDISQNEEVEKTQTEEVREETTDSNETLNETHKEEKKMAKENNITAEQIQEYQKQQAEKAIRKQQKKDAKKAQKKADKHTLKLIDKNWKKFDKRIDKKLQIREKSRLETLNKLIESRDGEEDSSMLETAVTVGLIGVATYGAYRVCKGILGKDDTTNTINVGVPTNGIKNLV